MPLDMQASVADMKAVAGEFFAKPRAERCACGNLRLFRSKVIGYRELGGGSARFLELHALAGGRGAVPKPAKLPQMGKVAQRLHAQLQGMGRQLLTWLAEHVGVEPQALLHCLDEAELENLDPGDCGASVLRLCCYGLETEEADEPQVVADPASGAAEDAGSTSVDGTRVVFDEHTDASFLTLAPVGTSAGLEMRDPATEAWVQVEQGLSEGVDLIIFIGDFVEVLTKGTYTAARHRVTIPSGEAAATPEVTESSHVAAEPGRVPPPASTRRLSMPFLLRGQPESTIDTSPFIHSKEDEELLARISDMSYANLRRFLDLKGRRRFQGQRLLQPAAGPGAGD